MSYFHIFFVENFQIFGIFPDQEVEESSNCYSKSRRVEEPSSQHFAIVEPAVSFRRTSFSPCKARAEIDENLLDGLKKKLAKAQTCL